MMMTEKKNVQCTWQERVIDLLDFLKQEGLSPDLLDGIREFNAQYPTPPELQNRIPQPRYHYYGKDVWEAAVAAILCGENLLLAGSKATGKNVLAENLAQVFARPAWDVSFHVNMDAASLIGMDTFEGGEVRFRPGPVYLCAKHGGFGVLDEIKTVELRQKTSAFVRQFRTDPSGVMDEIQASGKLSPEQVQTILNAWNAFAGGDAHAIH